MLITIKIHTYLTSKYNNNSDTKTISPNSIVIIFLSKFKKHLSILINKNNKIIINENNLTYLIIWLKIYIPIINILKLNLL